MTTLIDPTQSALANATDVTPRSPVETPEQHRQSNRVKLVDRLKSHNELSQLLSASGVDRLWIIGPEAQGNPMPTLLISLQSTHEGEVPPYSRRQISSLLATIMGKSCLSVPWAIYQSHQQYGIEITPGTSGQRVSAPPTLIAHQGQTPQLEVPA